MKDLELKDIMDRPVRSFTLLSVYRNGRWIFATPINPLKTVDNQNFYLISEKFGVARQGTTNPAILARRGSPGDYLSIDQFGVYAIVTQADYKRLFPAPNLNPPSVPTNSAQLKDPKFITKIQQESIGPDSDKVMIGTRQFAIKSTAGKTVQVVDTPSGQAKIFYDSSGGAYFYNYETGQMEEKDVPDKPY